MSMTDTDALKEHVARLAVGDPEYPLHRVLDELEAALGASPPPPDLPNFRAYLDGRIAVFERDQQVSSYRLVLDELRLIRAALGRATPEEPSRE